MTKNEKKQNNDDKNHEKVEENKSTEAVETKKELTETEKLSLDLLKAYERIDELTDTTKRLQADFENYKKRVEKDQKMITEYASSGVITKLLPIIDTFEIALKETSDFEKYKEGTKMIYNELMNILKNEGVRKIDALNKQFDPYLHDAMTAVESKDLQKDTVVEVLQEGYKLKDRVIRHSKVKISK